MKYFVVILGVLALLAITQAQDDSVVAESSELKSSDAPPSDPPRPKPLHFDNGLDASQPVEGENQPKENDNSVENPPERVPVGWHVGISIGSG